MNRAEKPNPFRVLNLANKVGSRGVRTILNIPDSVSNIYSKERPEVIDVHGQVLFVESSPCFLHPIRKYIALTVVVSLAVSAVLALIMEQTLLSLDALGMTLELAAIFNVIFLPLILLIAWVFRDLQFWPIAIVRYSEGICTRLVYRKHWCMLDSLDPTLASGPFEWVSGRRRSPTLRWKLSEDLKASTHASWLKMQYKDRVRWVLLGLTDSPDNAVAAIKDWADIFELNLSDVLTEESPPDQVPYLYRPKLL